MALNILLFIVAATSMLILLVRELRRIEPRGRFDILLVQVVIISLILLGLNQGFDLDKLLQSAQS